MKAAVILALLLSAPTAPGQVVVASAGSSDILQTPFGVGALVYTRDTTNTVGVGFTDGEIRWSASTLFDFRQNEITLGDSVQPSAGLAFALRGARLTRKSGEHHQVLTVFIGAVGRPITTGFYQGFTPLNFGVGVDFTRTFLADDSLRFETSENLDANWRTAMQSVFWTRRRFSVNATGGILQNTRTLNLSGSVQPWRHLRFNGGHGNLYLWVPTSKGEGTAEHSSVNTVSASFNFGVFSAHGGIVESVANGIANGGESVGAGLHFEAVTFTADYFIPKTGLTLLNTSTTFKINRHWTVTGYVSDAGGNWSANPGVSYTSNDFSAIVGYQVLYYPFSAGAAFQKTLTAQVSFHAPHSSTVNASTAALPNGKILYTIGGNSWFEGPIATGRVAEPPQHEGTGKYEYAGHVSDDKGNPIEGAAILIGKSEVFTDERGDFNLRSKRAKTMPLRVEPKDFTTPVDYEFVSTTSDQIEAVDTTLAAKQASTPILIVVRRKQ
jgi:hypothetical protein